MRAYLLLIEPAFTSARVFSIANSSRPAEGEEEEEEEERER